jgi:hypothetical protein
MPLVGAEDGERGQQGVPETAFRLAIPELERRGEQPRIAATAGQVTQAGGETPCFVDLGE